MSLHKKGGLGEIQWRKVNTIPKQVHHKIKKTNTKK